MGSDNESDRHEIMGDLSANFSTDEFRCKCCGKLVLDTKLPNALQQLRNRVGRPIKILSGYRCPKHNKAVGGAPASKHVSGEAADFTVSGYSVIEIAGVAESSPDFKGGAIGMYPENQFVHGDVRSDGPKRWIRLKGKYYYF